MVGTQKRWFTQVEDVEVAYGSFIIDHICVFVIGIGNPSPCSGRTCACSGVCSSRPQSWCQCRAPRCHGASEPVIAGEPCHHASMKTLSDLYLMLPSPESWHRTLTGWHESVDFSCWGPGPCDRVSRSLGGPCPLGGKWSLLVGGFLD